MTALEITKALKANRNGVLWVNDDSKQAAYHPGGGISYCTPVGYNDAILAKTDPAFIVISNTDGNTYAAA